MGVTPAIDTPEFAHNRTAHRRPRPPLDGSAPPAAPSQPELQQLADRAHRRPQQLLRDGRVDVVDEDGARDAAVLRHGGAGPCSQAAAGEAGTWERGGGRATRTRCSWKQGNDPKQGMLGNPGGGGRWTGDGKIGYLQKAACQSRTQLIARGEEEKKSTKKRENHRNQQCSPTYNINWSTHFHPISAIFGRGRCMETTCTSEVC